MAAMISGAGVSARGMPPGSMRRLLPRGSRERGGPHLCRAVRTQRPAKTQAAVTVDASPRKLRPAIRTHDELLLDLAAAGGTGTAHDTVGGRLEECLRLERQSPLLLQGPRRAQHEIYERAEKWRQQTQNTRSHVEGGR